MAGRWRSPLLADLVWVAVAIAGVGTAGCGGSTGPSASASSSSQGYSSSSSSGSLSSSATTTSPSGGVPTDDPHAAVNGPAFRRFVLYALERNGVKPKLAGPLAGCIIGRLERQGIRTAGQAEHGRTISAPLTQATSACASAPAS